MLFPKLTPDWRVTELTVFGHSVPIPQNDLIQMYGYNTSELDRKDFAAGIFLALLDIAPELLGCQPEIADSQEVAITVKGENGIIDQFTIEEMRQAQAYCENGPLRDSEAVGQLLDVIGKTATPTDVARLLFNQLQDPQSHP